ncbi:hypothetical protein HF072_09860 [Bacillus sp. RO3]|nr:hypothetical protein [Bacillus sp. RO3]
MSLIDMYRRTIIHFNGHGSDQDEIVFQDNQVNAKLFSKEAIAQTMMSTSDEIKLVFFNTVHQFPYNVN